MIKNFLILILGLMLALSASAQGVIDDELDTLESEEATKAQALSSASLDFTPRIPNPSEEFTVQVRDFSININSAQIVWYVNGSELERGIGLTQITTTAGETGERTTIRAVITPVSGEVREATGSITTAGVDLLWNANTFTPPFYKGKALYSPQATITIAAIPQFPNGNTNLVYTWRQNNRILGSESGFGKNSITLTGSILNEPISVSVEVSNQDQTIQATDSIAINPQGIDVILYEESPLYGTVYERALSGGYNLSSPEITVRAVPYNISLGNITYGWTVNNTETNQTGSTITLRNEQGIAGSSRIGVLVENVQKLLQQTSKEIIINFR